MRVIVTAATLVLAATTVHAQDLPRYEVESACGAMGQRELDFAKSPNPDNATRATPQQIKGQVARCIQEEQTYYYLAQSAWGDALSDTRQLCKQMGDKSPTVAYRILFQCLAGRRSYDDY